jgi:hypothetical protein
MSETGDKDASRDRSPAFPVIPLEMALGRLTEFDAHFKRSPARPEKVGDAWKINTKSYADRIAAALRYYGLLGYEGSGKERRITVSEEGRKYLRAQQEETKFEVVKKAALRPKQIAHFWNEWGTDRPADAAAIDQLALESGFSDAGARDFLKVYDATIAFAKLSESDKVSPIEDGKDASEGNVNLPPPPPPAIKVGDYVRWVSNGVEQFQQPRRIVGIFPDGAHVQVFGSNTGIPMSELNVVDPPAPPPPGALPPRHVDSASAGSLGDNDYNVLQTGGRLQITADVDLEGLQELKAMLVDYESILKRIAGRREGGIREKLKALKEGTDIDDEPQGEVGGKS